MKINKEVLESIGFIDAHLKDRFASVTLCYKGVEEIYADCWGGNWWLNIDINFNGKCRADRQKYLASFKNEEDIIKYCEDSLKELIEMHKYEIKYNENIIEKLKKLLNK